MHRPKVLIACGNEERRRSLTEAMRFNSDVVPVGDGWLALHLVNADAFSAMVIAEELESLSGLDVAYSVRDSVMNSETAIMLIADKISDRIREMYHSGVIDHCIDQNTSTGAFLFQFNAMRAVKAEKSWDTLDPSVSKVLCSARKTYNSIFETDCSVSPLDPALLDSTADCIVEMIEMGKVTAVMSALKGHEDSLFVHSLSVASVLAFYGREVGIKGHDLNVMAQAGFAHDIGKRATPHSILYKPSQLNDSETKIVREHASTAGNILRVSDGVPQEVIQVAERHHEKVDGTGYPNNLTLYQLDELSMVASISDVFSALTDRRSYRESLNSSDALRMLQNMAGDHLEPCHTSKFIEVIQDTGFTLA